MRDPLELIAAYFDDSLSPGESGDLRAWLQADEDHLRQFVRESVVHSRLRDVLIQHDMRSLVRDEFFGDTIDPHRIASLLDEEELSAARRAQEEAEQARRKALAAARLEEQLDRKLMRLEEPRTHNAIVYATLAAAAVLFMMIGRFIGPSRHGNPPPVAQQRQTPAPAPLIAEITKTLNAKIQAQGRPIDLGAKLNPGLLIVGQGAAEVTFAGGAAIIVEGPARLELASAERARLISGRVVAHVPQQAVGFTLASSKASIIDLGTEFGLEVDDAGVTSVHVIDGEVALVADKKNDVPSRTLQRGKANAVAADGSVREIPFDEARFLRRVPASAYELYPARG